MTLIAATLVAAQAKPLSSVAAPRPGSADRLAWFGARCQKQDGRRWFLGRNSQAHVTVIPLEHCLLLPLKSLLDRFNSLLRCLGNLSATH